MFDTLHDTNGDILFCAGYMQILDHISKHTGVISYRRLIWVRRWANVAQKVREIKQKIEKARACASTNDKYRHNNTLYGIN